jgi:hypothetical protein
MVEDLKRRPSGVTFNALSESVFDILAEYTAFPWAILTTQAKRVNVDPAALTPADLPALIDLLAEGVGRFTSPEKRDRVRAKLLALAQRVGV